MKQTNPKNLQNELIELRKKLGKLWKMALDHNTCTVAPVSEYDSDVISLTTIRTDIQTLENLLNKGQQKRHPRLKEKIDTLVIEFEKIEDIIAGRNEFFARCDNETRTQRLHLLESHPALQQEVDYLMRSYSETSSNVPENANKTWTRLHQQIEEMLSRNDDADGEEEAKHDDVPSTPRIVPQTSVLSPPTFRPATPQTTAMIPDDLTAQGLGPPALETSATPNTMVVAHLPEENTAHISVASFFSRGGSGRDTDTDIETEQKVP